jgi:hypothetical protein
MKKNPFRQIGASVLVTVALIATTYLLLPKDTSIGAATRPTQIVSPPRAVAASIKADQKRARMTLGQLPLSFEANRGQYDPQVQFASRGAGYKAFFTQTEAVFVLRKPGAAPAKASAPLQGTNPQRAAQAMQQRAQQAAERAASKAVLRVSLTGADPAPGMTGVDELAGKLNYFRGNQEQKWITNVPTFRRISYNAVYPGIDLIYYGKGNQLEYDLVIAPGADPNRIAFAFDGAERVEVDANSGALVITAASGAQLRQEKPLIYQEVDGMRRAVSGGFKVNGTRAAFSVGDYDRSRPLVIDPAIISYSTYLAGESDDQVHGIAADSDGNTYAVGWTESELFPVKNAYQAGQNNDSAEAFVTKFNADGSQLIWSTYLGGGDGIDPCGECGIRADEGAYGVALDSDRNVYVTGFTFSSDFPTYLAMQPQLSDALTADADSFITKIAAAGDRLVFSTYFGGADGSDSGRGIALDKNNNIYVVGYTNSFAFPTTNPIQREIDGRIGHFHTNEENFDGYLAKIDASGQFRIYSTYIGGPSQDIATAVAVDGTGAAYVTGWTDSTQPEPTPDPSATATPDPSASPTPTPAASPAIHFPITDNTFQQNPGGGGFTRDAFVTKVDPAGTQYIYSTYLGGNGSDVAWGIALGPDSSAYVTGYTNSGQLSAGIDPIPGENEFPTTANAFQPNNAGGFDAFLTRFNPNGNDLIYSTYIGGEFDEGDGAANVCLECSDQIDGGAVAVDVLGNAYITGWTESTFVATPAPSATATATATATVGDRPNAPNGAPSPTPVNFPIKDAFQPDPGSSPGSSSPQSRDAFVSMFNTNQDGDDSLVYSSFLGGSRRDEGQAITVDPGGNPFVAGWTETDSDRAASTGPGVPGFLNDFPTTAGAFQEEPSGGADGWVVAFAGGSAVIGQGQGFTISGQVTLLEDGSPVEGVTITLDKPDNTTATTTTDALGTYSFQNLPPVPEAPYIVTPSGLGYEYTPPSQEVVITNKNERADFVAHFPEPTPTPSASPTATATATATPTGTAASQPVNLSTRLHVLTGDQVGIGGFIITGSSVKHVIVRAIGPDLRRFGIPNPLEDPVLELHGPTGFTTIINNNWRDTQEVQIKATGLAPTNDLESAIDAVLSPGSYTGIIRGNNEGTGIGLIEVYDLDTASASKLSNLSTRGFVGGTPGDAIIAGFILGNQNLPDHIIIRGLGPSLSGAGVPNTLQNPTLELHNGDGVLLFTNNDWQDNPTNAAEVAAAGLAPSDTREAAIAVTLPPGAYTAILAGLGGTVGNGIVEIYDRGVGP